MDVPLVNTLEKLQGEEARNWIRARTVTAATWAENPELLTMAFQFSESMSAGRVSINIPDRLSHWWSKPPRPNIVTFHTDNVADLMIFEWPEDSESPVQITIGLTNGASIFIYLNPKGRVVGVDSYLDELKDTEGEIDDSI